MRALTLMLLGRRRPITESMAAWYRKGVGITSSSGAVSAWSDQSGNSRHLLQATGAAQPALQADGTILFDGVAHFLKTSAFTFNQPETVYLLLKQVTWTANDFLMDGNASNGGRLGQEVSSPTLRLNAGVLGAAANTDLAVNTYGAVAVVINGASSLIQVGYATPTTGDAGVNNMGGFTLGALGNGASNFANIQVKEVILYTAAHDASQRARNIAYLTSIT